MNASPVTKITSWLKFLGKNLHLVGCATLCAKSEVMLLLVALIIVRAHKFLCFYGFSYRDTYLELLNLFYSPISGNGHFLLQNVYFFHSSFVFVIMGSKAFEFEMYTYILY